MLESESLRFPAHLVFHAGNTALLFLLDGLPMLDGSARFINNSIDLSVWQAISTRADGEPTAEF